MVSFFKLVFILFILMFVILGWIAYSFYRQVRKNAQHFNSYANRKEHYSQGDTIIDNRSPEEKAKQVIKDNEGEYVDFTEIDNTSKED